MQKNEQMYLSQKNYWSQAGAELKNLRKLVFAALVVALRIALSGLFIPVGANLRIYFHFFITALGGVICGPVLSLLIGFAADILGFILFPSGAFFFGYTISSMVGAFLYGCFLYKKHVSLLRLFFCKAAVNIGVNVLLGSLWSAILYSKGYYFYFVQSITKNLILLPVEVTILYLFFKVILPVAAKADMVSRWQEEVFLFKKKQ